MRLFVAAIVIVALAACELGEDGTLFTENGVALHVPSTWSVTGFSVDVTPRRLVAASYDVRPGDVEGDCGGQAAILRLPRDGAYVVLIDDGPFSGHVERDDFNPDQPTFGRDEPSATSGSRSSAASDPATPSSSSLRVALYKHISESARIPLPSGATTR